MKSSNLYSKYVASILFILSPLLTLPYILYGIYYRRKSAFLLFSLFLGVFAWLTAPFADLYRHTFWAYEFVDIPVSTIVFDLEPDFLIPLIDHILLNNDIPYQYLRLFYTTECFWLMSIIFIYQIKHSKKRYSNNEYFVRFILFFLFFEVIQTVSSVRYGFALYQFIFAIHLFFYKKEYMYSLLFAFFACIIHTSFSFIIPLSFLLYVISSTKKRLKWVLITVPIFAVLAFDMFLPLLSYRADWYFQGGISGKSESTLFGLILYLYMRVFLFPFPYLALKYYLTRLHWCRICIAFTTLVLVFINNEVLLFRMAFLLSAVGVFVLLEIESYVKIRNRIITMILWCGIFTTLCNTINYRQFFYVSRYHYTLMPVPFILMDHYDIPWIISHIDGNNLKNQ